MTTNTTTTTTTTTAAQIQARIDEINVQDCLSQGQHEELADLEFELWNRTRFFVKVNRISGDLFWIVDKQSKFPAGDGRAAVWSGNDESIARCKCKWLNGDFAHVGTTQPPSMD